MRIARTAALVSLWLLAVPTASSARWFRVPPSRVAVVPAGPEAPEAAWQLALRLVWEDGVVRATGPEQLGWTAEDAVAAAVALAPGRDRRDAFAAWVAGDTVWQEAVFRADVRRSTTGEDVWPVAELPAAPRRVILEGWQAAVTYADLLTLQWPIADSHRVSSRFGPRVHPVRGVLHPHAGVDLSVPIGTEVLAAQDGVVVSAGEGRISGRFVILDHGAGLTTAYLHLDALQVGKGERIERGGVVGLSGGTGRVTGPHLHFEVRLRGEEVDPEPLREVRVPRPGV